MDFELSDDQVALRDAARSLLAGLSSPEAVRAHLTTGDGYDAKLWGAMVDQGWLAVDVPEADGGLGYGFVEAAILIEACGHHAAPAPVASTILALGAVAGTDLAEPLLAGGIGAAAWDDGRGERVLVPYAPVADVVVLASADGVRAIPAPKPAAEPAMDVTRCIGWVERDTAGAVEVGGPDEAQLLLDRGAVATSAESLGAADRVLAMAVEHAKERVQFGKPIGSFQAVKHRCADMLVDVEGMRSSTCHGAWSLAAADPEASVAASTAKAWCADAGRRVMASGLQVHGGIGFTWEHDLHLFLKRTQLDQVSFGDATFHRRRLATLLRDKVASGQPIV